MERVLFQGLWSLVVRGKIKFEYRVEIFVIDQYNFQVFIG